MNISRALYTFATNESLELVAREGDHRYKRGIGTYSEDVIKLFKRSLLGFRHEEEDHDEGHCVETSVEAKGTDDFQASDQERERDAEESGEPQASGDSETHTKLTVRQGEHFGGVGERHRTLTGRVEGGKQVHEEGDQRSAERSVRLLGNEGAETSSQ